MAETLAGLVVRPDRDADAQEIVASGKNAPRAARRFVHRLLVGTPDELAGRARQVVTELVANSVRHGSGPVTVEAWLESETHAVVLAVTDEGSGFELAPRVAGHADNAGWGLTLVDMLSEGWTPGGTGRPCVCVRLEPRDETAVRERGEDELEGRIRDLLDVRLVLDSVKDYGILALDCDGGITLWNAGAERLTGYLPADVLGSPLSLLHEEEDDPLSHGDLGTAMAHGRHQHESWIRRKDGSRFWADCVITPIADRRGGVRGFTEVMRDVTWRRRIDEDREGLIRRIRELARTDELTGLPNRRRWQEELDRELGRARRRGSAVCVAMIDVDSLKQVNDTHGHLAGDQLLRDTAAAWSEALRTTDTIARYGGDEFSVILPDCTIDEARTVIERVRAATPPPATCSAGLAASGGSESAEGLVGRADTALLDAKRRGKDTVAVAIS